MSSPNEFLNIFRRNPGNLRTLGISREKLREEVLEYFEAGVVIRPGDVVMDVGANVGAFSLMAAERTGGNITLHCFEPAVPTFQVLQRNFKHQTIMKRTRRTVNCLALTRPEMAGQEREFHFFKRFPTDSTYDLPEKRRDFENFFKEKSEMMENFLAKWIPLLGAPIGAGLRALIQYVCNRENSFGMWLADIVTGRQVMICRMESLENWVRQQKIEQVNLLKIDVEGAEADVLAGVGQAWPIIQQVAIETHDRSDRKKQIIALLKSKGLNQVNEFSPKVVELSALDNVLLVARRMRH
jgi:FkbM family methyltransferase